MAVKMGKPRLLLKYPTRSRPDQFRQTVEHYIALLANPEDTRFLFSCDTDDLSMNNDAMKAYIAALPVGNDLRWGPSEGKVAAINRDLNDYEYPWDIVLWAADDLLPNVYGYDNLIRDAFLSPTKEGEHDLDALLWIKDGRQTKICTIAAMGRDYYNRFGYIYHPQYQSLWCDNEQLDVARKFGKVIEAPCWIENLSPDWGGSIARDALYQRNNRFLRIDERTYHKRRIANFPA